MADRWFDRVRIDSWYEDEIAAYAREAILIDRWKRLHEGGPLTNKARAAAVRPVRAGDRSDDPVVIKPVKQFVAKPTQRYPNKTFALKPRTAIAIVAAAAAQGVVLADGAVIDRRVSIDHVDGLLENGVCCDLLTSGAVDIITASLAADERLKLRPGMAWKIAGLVGLQRCIELGVFDG